MSPGLRLEALKSHAELLGAEVVHVPSTEVDGPLVGALRAIGLRLHAADADTPGDLRRALGCGVDQLTTTDIETAVALRAEACSRKT